MKLTMTAAEAWEKEVDQQIRRMVTPRSEGEMAEYRLLVRAAGTPWAAECLRVMKEAVLFARAGKLGLAAGRELEARRLLGSREGRA